MGDEPSPPSQWYRALLQNVKIFDDLYPVVVKNGPGISAAKFQELDTIAMVIIEANANDGVKTDIENAIEWVSLQMMILKQDLSKQPNLRLLEMLEESLNNLKRKSLNDNTKKSSQVCRNVIFDMIHEKL